MTRRGLGDERMQKGAAGSHTYSSHMGTRMLGVLCQDVTRSEHLLKTQDFFAHFVSFR